MVRFDQLDAEQTDAVLELKLYRLAKSRDQPGHQAELKEKRSRAEDNSNVASSTTAEDDMQASGRWSIVREELDAMLPRSMAETHAKKTTPAVDASKIIETVNEAT